MKKNKLLCIFCLVCITAICKGQGESYSVLKRDLDGSYYKVPNTLVLKFTIDGEYNSMNLDYHVYDFHRTVMTGLSLTPATLNNGDNRFALNVAALATGYYILEVINQKKEKRVLRFYKP